LKLVFNTLFFVWIKISIKKIGSVSSQMKTPDYYPDDNPDDSPQMTINMTTPVEKTDGNPDDNTVSPS
jgi:hypothetical protein